MEETELKIIMINKNSIKKIFDGILSLSTSRYGKNTFWLLAERIIRIAINFFVTIYLVKYLGPDNFGLLSYAISFVSILASFAALGMDSIIVRDLIAQRNKSSAILGTSFYLRLVSSVISVILIFIVLTFSHEELSTSLLILVISTSTIFQSLNVIDFYFQAQVQSKFTVYAQFTSLVISSALKIYLIIIKASLIYFTYAIALESLLFAIGLIVMYKIQKEEKLKWHFSFYLSKKILKDAFPLLLAGVVVAVYMKIDQIMIKKMLDNSQAGYYSAAVKLCELWYFIPMAISNSIFPAIVSAKKTSEKKYNLRMQRFYDIMAWLSVGVSIPLTIFAPQIITLLYGAKFISAVPVLQIYIWSSVATFLGVASSQYLVAENLTKLSFYRTLLGMMANVALNFILIPKIGIVGSALATLISYSLATFSIIFYKNTYNQVIMMIRSLFFISISDYFRKENEIKR
jgi:O-antigen/teichoic acid export membrane protein